MSQLRSEAILRSRGSSENSSRQTAWKISDASSGLAPYRRGIAYMSVLYLLISADHAGSLPARHARTSRSSLHPRCGSPTSLDRGEVALSGRATRPLFTPKQLVDVPQRMVIEERGPEIAERPVGAHQHVRAGEKDHREILGDQLLDAVIQPFSCRAV